MTICRFKSKLLLKYANPCRNWTLQGQHRRKDATEQMKNLTLARTRTQFPGFSCAYALTTNLRMAVAEPNFYPYNLSHLKFTQLPSLHVDFYSRHIT